MNEDNSYYLYMSLEYVNILFLRMNFLSVITMHRVKSTAVMTSRIWSRDFRKLLILRDRDIFSKFYVYIRVQQLKMDIFKQSCYFALNSPLSGPSCEVSLVCSLSIDRVIKVIL